MIEKKSNDCDLDNVADDTNYSGTVTGTFKKSKYFELGDAVDDIKYATGAKDTALSALTLFGKGIFNVGCFAVTEVVPAVAKQLIAKGEEAKAIQEEKRLQEEIANPPEKKIGDKMTPEEEEAFIQKQLHETFDKPLQEIERESRK